LNNYPDTNTSNLQINPQIANQTWSVNSMFGNNNQSGFSPRNPYNIVIPNS